MEIIRVEGGYPLRGTVCVEGSKNDVLKLMAATIMAPGVSVFENVPNIADVHTMGKVIKRLGAEIEVVDEHTLKIDTSNLNSWETPYSLVSQMRASTAVLSPLLVRFGEASVAMPGGCNIGARKIDMHMQGLEALGVEFEVKYGYIHATTPHGLVGTTVQLPFASVGATENLLMAACAAKGTTVIVNAAREPEIVDLACLLGNMGAKINGAGTPVITIEGVDTFCPVHHRTIGDRIEAGTYLAMGALMGGPVEVKGFNPAHLDLVLKKYEQMGICIERNESSCTVHRDNPLSPLDIQTMPYPGFPTDMQSQTMCLLALAKGTSIITENIFENRFIFASELLRMGADISIQGHHAVIHGVDGLWGTQVKSPDLRGGAALVMAALSAEGKTDVYNIEHIERGYERFTQKLSDLGAHIAKIEVSE